MHPQLTAITDELRSARERLHRLAGRLPADAWTTRPRPEAWSVAECVEHLNLTGRAYLPLLEAGLAEARRLGGAAPARYRRDPIGWLLWRTMGPPVKHRVKTAAPFVPGATAAPAALVAEFDRLQEEQLRLVAAADGLPLQRVRVRSPFAERVRYNLYSCLTLLAPHQHRHLWQAEQVVTALPAAPVTPPSAGRA